MVSKERKNRRNKKEKTERQWNNEFEDIRRMYENGGKRKEKDKSKEEK